MKHAWIIGGSHGVGEAVVSLMHKQGWSVTVSARNSERLNELKARMNVSVIPMDVTDLDQVKTAVKQAYKMEPPPTHVLINVGDYDSMPIDEYDYDLFRRLVEINYLGPVGIMGELLSEMKKVRSGKIWVNASIAAYRGLPQSAPYNASKAATLSLVESLYPEARQWGIHIGVINHGFVRTRLTAKNTFKMPGLLEPEEAAIHIVAGIQKNKFEITFPRIFTLWMKLLRCLPYSVYFILMRRLAT